MTYPKLSRNDYGDQVKRLQSLLNRVGAMLVTDGDFGPGTEKGVRYAQDIAGQPETGSVDSQLWQWLEAGPEPYPSLPTDGIAFIAREETGGLAYYEQKTRWPHYPGYASGITIGVGYDLRYKTEDAFRESWGTHLPPNFLDELARDIARKGSKERAQELKRFGVEVPFKAAWAVFLENTLPRFYADTESVFPSLPRLPGMCRAVLVSLVFNRGTSLDGDRRREMRAIRDILHHADDAALAEQERKTILLGVEDQIISMKRLWSTNSGLNKRRQSEANLWRAGLASS
ncbi:MAG: peptidoglycan-binding protein [Deltaproteobacteria bacterium]|nr:peptidoglycan-binding protein [Deltaproteobacteria bacterium]